MFVAVIPAKLTGCAFGKLERDKTFVSGGKDVTRISKVYRARFQRGQITQRTEERGLAAAVLAKQQQILAVSAKVKIKRLVCGECPVVTEANLGNARNFWRGRLARWSGDDGVLWRLAPSLASGGFLPDEVDASSMMRTTSSDGRSNSMARNVALVS